MAPRDTPTQGVGADNVLLTSPLTQFLKPDSFHQNGS